MLRLNCTVFTFYFEIFLVQNNCKDITESAHSIFTQLSLKLIPYVTLAQSAKLGNYPYYKTLTINFNLISLGFV